MTDSLKLAEMQRTSIEFERQRHLANWFIKSSQHMATPSSSLNSNGSTQNVNNKGQKSNGNSSSGGGGGANNICGKNVTNTTTTTNPLYFIVSGQKPHQPQLVSGGTRVASSGGVASGVNGNGNLALSRSQIFTSQTNLPLQIVTSGQEGHKPKLRRFNSHDTSANMFSVADFENARLARRNDIEMKQRLQQRLKMNSLSSGGDCSTGDSKGSKYSNDSQPEPLIADIFLDRYSLPRVVRISHKPKFSHETLQSSSSNGSSSTNSSTSLANNNHKINDNLSKQNGELYLLYRHLRQRNIYHGFNAKSGTGSRKKGVMIPQEFPGFFSLINEKGAPIATMYTALVQLVRERVYKFISVDNLPAYTESQTTDTFPPRSHYVKSTARGGQIFRLLAVFEDGKQQEQNSSTSNKNTTNSGREKEKGRYAQLLNENRQILYVSLSAKGKFYEIEPGIPQILQKTGINKDVQQKKINPDCVHRINNLITQDTEFPINIKFISGPPGTVNIIPENLTVTKITTENVLIACPIEDVESRSPLHLRKLYITPEMTLTKCFLGFENEQRMLANQNVQNILKFCQFNCDTFLKMIEMEMINRPERNVSRSKVDGLKILKPLNFPKLLRREKSSIAHEKEDSIIFLSKNDLANLESSSKDDLNSSTTSSTTATNHTRISDKMKVFQSNKKKWFKRNDKHTSLTNLDLDVQAKRMSMERYNDMSKLLQERFGDDITTSTTPTSTSTPTSITTTTTTIPQTATTSSLTQNQITIINEQPHSTSEIGEIYYSNNNNNKIINNKMKTNQIQKSLSLQDVDFIDKPDLLPSNLIDTNYSNDNLNHIDDHQQQQEQYHLQPQQSFISEKMYSEFHVKTRQFSKSSSSLHQLLHFGQQQNGNNNNNKKSISKLLSSHNQLINSKDLKKQLSSTKKFQQNDIRTSNINDQQHQQQLLFLNSNHGIKTNQTTIIDDLPYSSVRDSLITTDINEDDNNYIDCNVNIDVGASGSTIIGNNYDNNTKILLNHNNLNNHNCNNNNNIITNDDNRNDSKENIYAEICHDGEGCGGGGGGAISRVQINVTTNHFNNSNNINTISTTINNDYNNIIVDCNNLASGSGIDNNSTSIITNVVDDNNDDEYTKDASSQSNYDGANCMIDNIYNTLK